MKQISKDNAFTLAEGRLACTNTLVATKPAFTLAEVLITLAIIGIVATLTIPTLIENHQQKAWNTAASVFEKKLEEATRQMNAEGTLAGYSTTMDFVNEFKKHIKINKICNSDKLSQCFSNEIIWSDTEAKIDISKMHKTRHWGLDDWNTELIGLQFSNGINGIIAYNPECQQDQFNNQITGTNCIAILYDVNAFANPNSNGKDLGSINITALNNVCVATINGNCYSKAFKPEYITYDECISLKNQLGIRNCYKEKVWNNYGEYWAGAVKRCGGVSNMPTKENLREIYNYIKAGDEDIIRAKLGLRVEDMSYYTQYLFSGIESNSYSAVAIDLRSGAYTSTSNYTPENGSYRWVQYHAICIE